MQATICCTWRNSRVSARGNANPAGDRTRGNEESAHSEALRLSIKNRQSPINNDSPIKDHQSKMSSPFVALQHRNFRLIWLGQLVSMAGSMMQSAAMLWHVSVLVEPSRRGLALGMVGLVRVVPIIVFSLIGGVVADASDRRRLMLVTQTG